MESTDFDPQPFNSNGVALDGQPKATAKEHNHVIPPYWQRHNRSESTQSIASLIPHRAAITLEDHTEEQCEQSKAVWAKQVSIDEYTVVSGGARGIGAYVVWSFTVETLNGGPMKIRKRYSEFDKLRKDLARTFPHAEGAMPQLPLANEGKARFQPKFLEQRRAGLLYFLNCILLNPEFAGSPIVKTFIFS